jgi:hypothetical protein
VDSSTLVFIRVGRKRDLNSCSLCSLGFAPQVGCVAFHAETKRAIATITQTKRAVYLLQFDLCTRL